MYILTENKQVLLGPMNWKPRQIQSELNDLEVAFTVPPVEQGYIKINDIYEIFPITEISVPEHNSTYEQLAGPFYTFTGNTASAAYTKQDVPIEFVKNTLKNLAAAERYKKEIAGVKVTIQGIAVTVDTERSGRNVFVQQYMLMGANDTTPWKFPEAWITLTKTDLGEAVAAGVNHIQAQFNWERDISNQITSATTFAELAAITIVAPGV
jgi:hypothetical protein